MTQNLPAGQIPRRKLWRLGLWIALRVLVSVTLLITAYYLVPTPDAGTDSDLPWLFVSLTIFGIIVGIQIPAIVNSKYPNLRAVEAMSVTVPLYLLIFARIYLSNALGNPGAFSEQLDHTKSLYFTITVFATVGFGDITPETNPMRLLVSLQMLLNLVVIGLVVKLLLGAAQRGVTKKRGSSAVATSAGHSGEKATGTPGPAEGTGHHVTAAEQTGAGPPRESSRDEGVGSPGGIPG
jgi:voltage-gated potassium channel